MSRRRATHELVLDERLRRLAPRREEFSKPVVLVRKPRERVARGVAAQRREAQRVACGRSGGAQRLARLAERRRRRRLGGALRVIPDVPSPELILVGCFCCGLTRTR